MKDLLSGRTVSLCFLIFTGAAGLCGLQLRSLYLKDLVLLQNTLEQRSARLDERLRRSVVAVESLQSEFGAHLKVDQENNSVKSNASGTVPKIEPKTPLETASNVKANVKDNVAALSNPQQDVLNRTLKTVPDAFRAYYIEPHQNAYFFPEKWSEKHEPSLIAEPLFQLGTPIVNQMGAAYWTKSFPSIFGGMSISRAAPVYRGEKFLGVVGMDILLNNLMDMVGSEIYGDAQIFVVGHDRHLLLHPRFNQEPYRNPIAAKTALPPELQPYLEQILQSESNEGESIAGYRVMHSNLRHVPWHFVLWIPENQLWWTTIKSSFWSSIVPWVGLMMVLALMMLEIQRRAVAQRSLRLKSHELKRTLTQLQETQARLVQNEKMSSLSQLVGGIAHEINNPINFIHGNLKPIQNYVKDLLALIQLYETTFPDANETIVEFRDDIDLQFIKSDLPLILDSMGNGTHRIRETVLLLRNFARMDEADLKTVDIHEGLESTLALMRYHFLRTSQRPEITIKKLFAKLPKVECYAGQLNQVFMGLMSNAIDAINDCPRDHFDHKTPTIEVFTTLIDSDHIQIQISDNGSGIPKPIQDQIFDPFFTTKPVGQGAGLGLAIAHQIVTERHSGTITCSSQTEDPSGSTFTIHLPISQVATFQSKNVPLSPKEQPLGYTNKVLNPVKPSAQPSPTLFKS